MQITYFFPTPLWSTKVDFDNDLLKTDIRISKAPT